MLPLHFEYFSSKYAVTDSTTSSVFKMSFDTNFETGEKEKNSSGPDQVNKAQFENLAIAITEMCEKTTKDYDDACTVILPNGTYLLN